VGVELVQGPPLNSRRCGLGREIILVSLMRRPKVISMHYERRPPGRSRLGVACLRSVAHWSGSPRRAAVG
jgi:hypothetical protein